MEFAIAASFLTVLVVSTYDFATLGRRSIEVVNAARAGTAYAQCFGWTLGRHPFGRCGAVSVEAGFSSCR